MKFFLDFYIPKMGYGYLGAYLVYGFPLEFKSSEESEDSEEDDELRMRNHDFHVFEENIFIKEWGFEEDHKHFLCWKCVFRGGRYWEPWQTPTENCKNSIDLEKMREIEESYDEEYVREVCEKYGIEHRAPSWQTLITVGQMLY